MKNSPQAPAILTVSIVLHNSSPQILERLVQSLYRAATIAHEAYCVSQVLVYVVDNSSDVKWRQRAAASAAAWPSSSFFHMEYREMRNNRGFGAGHNSVIRDLDGKFHLVLNPDVELAEDVLRIGLSCLQADDSIVLLSPRVSGDDGKQEFLCKRYPSFLVLFLRAFVSRPVQNLFRKRLDRYEMRDLCGGGQQADVPLASGCFMLVRTEALQAVGGFNDDYFLYFEDFDLSIRLGAIGRLVFNPAMRIVHHGGYTASKGVRHIAYFIRSAITFFNQHGWRWI